LLIVVQAGRERKPGAERRLACGRLALARGKNASHEDLLHFLGLELCPLDGGTDRRGSRVPARQSP
jgi:hypothetical protein